MSKIKPILFNSDMVRAILDGRKTVTRRSINHNITDALLHSQYHKEHPEVPDTQIIKKLCQAPYQIGDVLYVRERFCIGKIVCGEEPDGRDAYYVEQDVDGCGYITYEYCLRYDIGIEDVVWKPSIHMPKEAARIWLKVTDVR